MFEPHRRTRCLKLPLARLAILLIGLYPALATATDASPPAIEELRRQAVDAFNLRQYEKAETLFYGVLQADPSSPAALSSVEYLKDLTQRAGYLESAIQRFQGLKMKGLIPENFAGSLTSVASRFQIPGGLPEFLFKALQKGGVVSAHTFLISFLLEARGMEEEARFYFDEASRSSSVPPSRRIHRASYRPLHFSEAEFYERLRTPDYSFAQLQTISFLPGGTRMPEDLKPREEKRTLEGNLGVFVQYDSNIPEKASDGPMPTGVEKASGMKLDYLVSLGVRTRDGKPWVYGGDYRMWFQNPIRGDLAPYSRWSHVPAVWASWWNRTDTEFRVKYESLLSWKNSDSYKPDSRLHGPTLSLSRLWNERYQTDFLYSLKGGIHSREGDRTGFNHTAAVRFAYPGKNNAVQPFIRYVWNRDFADSPAASLIDHRLEIGASYARHEQFNTQVFTTIGYGIYPRSTSARRDHTTRTTAKAAFLVWGEFMSLMGRADYLNRGSNESAFAMSRFELTAGAVTHTTF